MIQDCESSFYNLGLNSHIVRALSDLGYLKPSLIQEKCIPYLLQGYDVLGLAQTGSGKTAAFILPLLQNIDSNLFVPQLLVLAPTRELAIQLGDVSVSLAKYIHNVRVISLYGGQKYDIQLRALNRGVQVVIGTPGRLLDHLSRHTLNLSQLHSLVIDEADEMLRMGFIEDVKKIVLNIPKQCQIALFSATFPKEIRRIACHFMTNPKEVYIGSGTKVSDNIHQNYWIVSGLHKQEALMRFLEVEDFDAALIFVRTKGATLEISNMLESNGYNSSALNGDMNQVIRQKTIERLRNGLLDILIATDVAARGLDLDRITLVINYDIPKDFGSYIHRIGRTGRAGRIGRSLSFVHHSEYRLLRHIERSINFSMSKVKAPTTEVLISNRLSKFINKVQKYLDTSTDLDKYRLLLSKIQMEKKLDIEHLAAVLLKIAQGKRLLLLESSNINYRVLSSSHLSHDTDFDQDHFNNQYSSKHRELLSVSRSCKTHDMNLYRINIGRKDGVEVHHIFGAIANEGDINSQCIGHIKLFASYSIIELSKSIPNNVVLRISRIRILNKSINIQCLGSNASYKKNHHYKLAYNKSTYCYTTR